MEAKQISTHRVIVTEEELLEMIRTRLGYKLKGARIKTVLWDPDFQGSKGPELAHNLVVDIQTDPGPCSVTEEDLERGLAT